MQYDCLPPVPRRSNSPLHTFQYLSARKQQINKNPKNIHQYLCGFRVFIYYTTHPRSRRHKCQMTAGIPNAAPTLFCSVVWLTIQAQDVCVSPFSLPQSLRRMAAKRSNGKTSRRVSI